MSPQDPEQEVSLTPKIQVRSRFSYLLICLVLLAHLFSNARMKTILESESNVCNPFSSLGLSLFPCEMGLKLSWSGLVLFFSLQFYVFIYFLYNIEHPPSHSFTQQLFGMGVLGRVSSDG